MSAHWIATMVCDREPVRGRFANTFAVGAGKHVELGTASNGLLAWWGPRTCHWFLGYGCTPSQRALWAILLLVFPFDHRRTSPWRAAAAHTPVQIRRRRISGGLRNGANLDDALRITPGDSCTYRRYATIETKGGTR